MKVIAINGSPRKNGNTNQALKIMADELEQQGIEVEIIQIGHLDIHGCIHCGYCWTSEDNHCVFKDDIVNETAKKAAGGRRFHPWITDLLCRNSRNNESLSG